MSLAATTGEARSVSVPFPFRTDIEAASDSEIERINRRYALKGDDAFAPLDEERRRFDAKSLLQAKATELSHETCVRYAHHPDERVVIDLMKRPELRATYWYFFLNIHARSRHPSLWEEWGLPVLYTDVDVRRKMAALNPLPDDPIAAPAWDPLLDVLDAEGQWPSSSALINPLYFAQVLGRASQKTLVETLSEDPRVDAWLASDPSEEEWLRLSSFNSPRFFAHLAERAPRIPTSVLRPLFRHPLTWRALAERLERTGTRQEHSEIHAFLCEVSEAALVKQIRSKQKRNAIIYERDTIEGVRIRLLQQDSSRVLQDETRSALHEVLDNHFADNLACTSDSWHGAEKLSLELLTLNPATPASELEEIYEKGSRALTKIAMLTLVRNLIYSPAATPGLWMRILKEQKGSSARLYLASHEPSATSPEVRKSLLKSRHTPIIAALARTATGGEFAMLFRKLGGADEGEIANVLEGATTEQLSTLAQRDILPLLVSKSSRIRLQAIRASAHASKSERESLSPSRVVR